jgi:hypothetical protein
MAFEVEDMHDAFPYGLTFARREANIPADKASVKGGAGGEAL